MDFPTLFERGTGHRPRPWQEALALPSMPAHRLIRIPTGFGKTLGVAATWLYHRVERRDRIWPARLVWMLPMRTLVEQTASVCKKLLDQLGILGDTDAPTAGKVSVHVFMGGSDSGPYHLHPSQPAILIGTQDMLLSRALNRGYGAARARWPIDFGLLSRDALWVLDEVQLMGVGLATAMQLAAFRHDTNALRPTWTWAMSATLQRSWLSVSPDLATIAEQMEGFELLEGDRAEPLWRDSTKPITLLPPASHKGPPTKLATSILEAHAALEQPGSLTLAICNTVERARALYDELVHRVRASKDPARVSVELIHSRFRGAERKRWAAALLAPPDQATAANGSRILVSTQVVEAGVDLSADLLFTELCAWPSLVQRLGRLARRGGTGRVVVQDLDESTAANPYDAAELAAARSALGLLEEASSRALTALEQEHPELLPDLYPYEPRHILLREELEELFDTTPDLSGGDLDISRYIREGDERDLQVAWMKLDKDQHKRPRAPAAEARPGADALCAVPFLAARDWLCGKKSGTSEPRRLKKGMAAFVWDYLGGEWRLLERKDLRPGAVVIVDADAGGYDPIRGFDPKSEQPVPTVESKTADLQERADSAEDQDDLSQAAYQTIGFHGGAVATQAARIFEESGAAESRFAPLLHLAARWHDLGKSHPAFQGAIVDDARPERTDLAKAPASAWPRGRTLYRFGNPPDRRPGFRHELASVLALFDVLLRWAPPDHPSRLGAWATAVAADSPRGGAETRPTVIEQEILALDADSFDLVAYLVCAHHGKLRARLHASPADQANVTRGDSLPIRGIYEGDVLPPVSLATSNGPLEPLPASQLSLAPATLGLSPTTGRSWTERIDRLRRHHGPFALAWLEALLRAADVLASRDLTLVDPAMDPAMHPALHDAPLPPETTP